MSCNNRSRFFFQISQGFILLHEHVQEKRPGQCMDLFSSCAAVHLYYTQQSPYCPHWEIAHDQFSALQLLCLVNQQLRIALFSILSSTDPSLLLPELNQHHPHVLSTKMWLNPVPAGCFSSTSIHTWPLAAVDSTDSEPEMLNDSTHQICVWHFHSKVCHNPEFHGWLHREKLNRL